MTPQERVSTYIEAKPFNVVFGIALYSLVVIDAALLYVLHIEPYLFPGSLRYLVNDTVYQAAIGIIVCILLYHSGRENIIKQAVTAPVSTDRFGQVRDVVCLVMFAVMLPIWLLLIILIMLLCSSPQELLNSLLNGPALESFVYGLCHGSPR